LLTVRRWTLPSTEVSDLPGDSLGTLFFCVFSERDREDDDLARGETGVPDG